MIEFVKRKIILNNKKIDKIREKIKIEKDENELIEVWGETIKEKAIRFILAQKDGFVVNVKTKNEDTFTTLKLMTLHFVNNFIQAGFLIDIMEDQRIKEMIKEEQEIPLYE